MADTKNQEEPTFPTKRKPEPNIDESGELPKKAQKLATLDENSLPPTDRSEANPNSNNNLEVPNSNCSSVTEEKVQSDVVPVEGGNVDEEEDDGVDSDDEYDDGDDDEDEDGEESNGDAEVDLKGKAVLREDKGKGKLIEEDDDSDDDDDDDDSGDGGSVSGGDSDLSDDPLAEVDLNNILPSRTRRRTTHPGLHIASDMGNDGGDDDDDSDDSNA